MRFKFSFDMEALQSLPSRIVICFHDLPTTNISLQSFPTRFLMREAIAATLTKIWAYCAVQPGITDPDVFVEVYEVMGRLEWHVLHSTMLYNRYIESLLSLSAVLPEEKNLTSKLVQFSSLTQVRRLGGRGSARVVKIAKSRHNQPLYVFKGVDFLTYLENPKGFGDWRDAFYHEIRTVCSLPKHPNIVTPPDIYVQANAIDDYNERRFLCGALFPILGDNNLDEEIEKSNLDRSRLNLMEKAKWSYQMASATAHTHLIAHTFHMDIKPSNFVVSRSKRDLILIDWEQSGAPLYTLAPEADGTWDVEREKDSGDELLVYKKYTGSPRENLAWSRPKWNIFPIWRESNPRALEAVEVFSLGRTKWMMLQQISQSEVEDLQGNLMVSASNWDGAATNDIPGHWKSLVNLCMHVDPNRRPRLQEIVKFWDKEVRALTYN